MSEDIFDSAVRSKGDLAGVFEYDGDTGYFYFYDMLQVKGKQILGSIHVFSGDTNLSESDVKVTWNKTDDAVGLYLNGQLWAAFDSRGSKYGGNYMPNSLADIPTKIVSSFADSERTN